MSDFVPTVQLLMKELSSVTQWDMMGLFLGLEYSDIKEIEGTYPLSLGRRKLEVFTLWKKREQNASWGMIVEALKQISELTLAAELAEKYIWQRPEPHTIPINPASSWRHNCADETAIAKPAVIMKVSKKDKVAQRFEEIEQEFALLVMRTLSVLESEKIPLVNLKRFVRYYLVECDLAAVSSMDELFDKMEPHYCFLNHTLLELIIKSFLKHTTISDCLSNYNQHLEEFKSSTTLRHFMENIEQAQIHTNTNTTTAEDGVCTVIIRLVGGWLCKTVKNFEALVKEIFQDKSSVLAHLKIVRGSLIVTYLAPHSMAGSLVTLAMERISFMCQVGVCGLQVGEEVVKIEQVDMAFISFESALLRAVENNDTQLLSFLLDLNTSPDTTAWTTLLVGSYSGHDEIHSLPLISNANPNFQAGDGVTALYIASQEGHTEVVRLLLKANANPNLLADDNTCALYAASENGHSEIVSLLLKANANPNLQAKDYTTPLFMASQHGYSEIVSLLLKHNANPDLQRDNGETPLYKASENGHSETVRLLLKASANPDLYGEYGVTALYMASQNGHSDIVSLLLEANANPNIVLYGGYIALVVASQSGHSDIVSQLLIASVDQALSSDDNETITTDIDHQVEDGTTALMQAHPHPEIVQLLLRNGADPNIQDKEGWTALMFACQDGYLETAELLLSFGADANLQNHWNETALIVSNYNCQQDLVDLLQRMDISSTSPDN